MPGNHARDQSPERRASSRLAKKKAYAMTVDMRECWEAFDAPEDPASDGEESCVATIYDRTRPKATYPGATGKGAGHAEMHGLLQLLQACEKGGRSLEDLLLNEEVEVLCVDKPCCARCSVILGLLGVKARKGTTKTKFTMGSTSYSIADELKQFIMETFGYTEGAVEYIFNIPAARLRTRLGG